MGYKPHNQGRDHVSLGDKPQLGVPGVQVNSTRRQRKVQAYNAMGKNGFTLAHCLQ